MDITNDQDQSKISRIKLFKVKGEIFKKQVSSKLNYTYSFCETQVFFHSTIGIPTLTPFQNTGTFDQYLCNSMSYKHVHLVHWNSLHPKKAVIPTFQDIYKIFSVQNHKTRTNNLHHGKAGSVAVVLSLRVGVQHVQKRVQ